MPLAGGARREAVRVTLTSRGQHDQAAYFLAIGAVLAGYLGVPHFSLIEHWLEPVFAAAANTVELPASPIEWVLMALSGLVAIGRAVFRLSGLRGGHGDPEACPGVAGLVRHAG